jgi:hypothetical protein
MASESSLEPPPPLLRLRPPPLLLVVHDEAPEAAAGSSSGTTNSPSLTSDALWLSINVGSMGVERAAATVEEVGREEGPAGSGAGLRRRRRLVTLTTSSPSLMSDALWLSINVGSMGVERAVLGTLGAAVAEAAAAGSRTGLAVAALLSQGAGLRTALGMAVAVVGATVGTASRPAVEAGRLGPGTSGDCVDVGSGAAVAEVTVAAHSELEGRAGRGEPSASFPAASSAATSSSSAAAAAAAAGGVERFGGGRLDGTPAAGSATEDRREAGVEVDVAFDGGLAGTGMAEAGELRVGVGAAEDDGRVGLRAEAGVRQVEAERRVV